MYNMYIRRLKHPSNVLIITAAPFKAQLHGDTVNQPPKFIIPTNDGEDGVEVKAKPWHEVQVQYALPRPRSGIRKVI